MTQSYDPELVRRAGTALQAVADDLDGAISRFDAQLKQFSDPWGMDMLGMLVGGGYVAIEQLAMRTLDSVVDSFDGDAEKLIGMADRTQSTEDGNAADFVAFQKEF